MPYLNFGNVVKEEREDSSQETKFLPDLPTDWGETNEAEECLWIQKY